MIMDYLSLNVLSLSTREILLKKIEFSHRLTSMLHRILVATAAKLPLKLGLLEFLCKGKANILEIFCFLSLGYNISLLNFLILLENQFYSFFLGVCLQEDLCVWEHLLFAVGWYIKWESSWCSDVTVLDCDSTASRDWRNGNWISFKVI